MHRPAVLTLNGGFKGFIVIHVAAFAPCLPWAKRTGSGRRCPSWSPPLQPCSVGCFCGCTCATGMPQPAQSPRPLSNHTTLISAQLNKYQLFCILCPLQKFHVLPPLYFRQQPTECLALNRRGTNVSPNNNLGFQLKNTLLLPTYLSFILH